MQADVSDELRLLTKFRALPPAKQAEVEDFVDYLRDKVETAALTHASVRASEPSFTKVWDNEDDAAYDEL